MPGGTTSNPARLLRKVNNRTRETHSEEKGSFHAGLDLFMDSKIELGQAVLALNTSTKTPGSLFRAALTDTPSDAMGTAEGLTRPHTKGAAQ